VFQSTVGVWSDAKALKTTTREMAARARGNGFMDGLLDRE
jgi:hypothetical protein